MANVPQQPQGFDEKHPVLGCCGNCLNFLHNSKSGTYCGKSCVNWLLIIIFYIFFLAAMLALLYSTVYLNMMYIQSKSSPWLTGSDNAMSSPGLGFKPLILKDQKAPLIWYTWDSDSRRHYQDYTELVKTLLEGYSKTSDNEICENLHSSRERDYACFFNTSLLGPCGTPEYGYDKNAPCIYLKLNKFYGWTPDCYDEDSLPNRVPSALKAAVEKHTSIKPGQGPYVWVSCSGVFPADEQHMGDVIFYPKPGFQPGYFPYLMQRDYHAPLVAVQFLRPDRNVLITVQCTAWAQNVQEKPVEIQIMVGRNPEVDNPPTSNETSETTETIETTETTDKHRE